MAKLTFSLTAIAVPRRRTLSREKSGHWPGAAKSFSKAWEKFVFQRQSQSGPKRCSPYSDSNMPTLFLTARPGRGPAATAGSSAVEPGRSTLTGPPILYFFLSMSATISRAKVGLRVRARQGSVQLHLFCGPPESGHFKSYINISAVQKEIYLSFFSF